VHDVFSLKPIIQEQARKARTLPLRVCWP